MQKGKTDLVPVGPTPAPAVFITCANPYKLARLIRLEVKREAIVVRSPVAEFEPGLWGVWVTRLKRPRRRWVRPALAVAGTAGVGAGGWWLVSTAVTALAGVSLVTVLPIVALALLAIRTLRGGGGRGGGSCQIDVRVTHRH